MNKIKLAYFIQFAILTSVIYVILVSVGLKSIGMQYNLKVYFFVFLGLNIVLYLCNRYKYLYIFIFFLILFISKEKMLNITLFIKEVIPFYKSVLDNQGIVNDYFNYYVTLIYIYTALLSIIVFYLIFIKRKTIYLLVLGVSYFSFYYFFGIDTFKQCNLFLIIWIYLFWMTRSIDIIENKKYEKNYIYTLMAAFVIFVFATNMMIKVLPYDKEGKGVKLIEFAQEIGEKINKKNDVVKIFDLSITGFQPNSNRLGGPIKLNHKKALQVYPNNYSGELYLRGIIKDFYSGHNWTKSKNNFIQNVDNFLSNQEGLRKFEIQIKPSSLVTETAFNSLTPEWIGNAWRSFYIDMDFLETKHPRPATSNDIYTVFFASYDYSVFTNYYKNSKAKNFNYQANSANLKYLQMPSNVSKNISELTYSIIKNSKNDLESAKLIQDYLRSNYVYDLRPSAVPNNEDFVEHFLFKEKKGYCIYFASAMAIMCRSIGIPARYVEGFAVNVTPIKEVDVLNSNAHAWVEVYINGLGFVTFDPTPGHYTTVDYAFDVLKNQEDIENKVKQIQQFEEKQVDEEKNVIKPVKEKDKNNYLIFLSIIFIAILAAIVFLKLIKEERNIKYYINQLKFIAFTYGHIEGGLTIEEMMSIINNNVNIDRPLEILNRVIYNNSKLSLEEKKVLNQTFKSIKINLKKQIGLKSFIVKKFIYKKIKVKEFIFNLLRSKKM